MTTSVQNEKDVTPALPECWKPARWFADYYGVTPKTVWEWARSGRIPEGRKIGANTTRWWPPEVDKSLRA